MRPLPRVDVWAWPYWESARRGRLVIQRCHACDEAVFYPRPACPQCGRDTLVWEEASGKATVYSHTTVESYAPSAFTDEVPFVIAIVQLDEGPRMMTNLIGAEPNAFHCGMAVQVDFMAISDEITLPVFVPEEVSDA